MAMIGSVNAYLQSWHAYFRNIRPAHPVYLRGLDGFLRRRVRSAIAGRYAKGHWQAQTLPNALLAELGLLSLERLQHEYLCKCQALPTSG